MRSPNWPAQLISGSSNRPATLANGCIISRVPTTPDEFARPSGCCGLADSSSSRGVPIALAATTTTLAGSKCSRPSTSIQVAPVARPRASVSILRTRAPGDEPCAERDRLGPVGQVRRRLGALVAARLAGAALDARAPAVVGDRVDRVELGPPVPAELGHAARDLEPGRPDRAAAASGHLRHRAGRPDRLAAPKRRTAGRSDRSTAAARSSRSASHRRRRRASGRGSRTAGRVARRRRR